MPTQTVNYGFTKDVENEFYDINKVNTNLDKIDTEIKRVENRVPEPQEISNIQQSLDNHLGDYEYQTPSIVGSQIRLIKKSNTSRLLFKLENDLTGEITVSLDGGVTNKKLVDIDGSQLELLEKGFVEVVAYANFFILRNRGGMSKADLTKAINDINTLILE